MAGLLTYFSEIEGFGNNLLEVLAAGLIPAIYEYPVYLKDLSEYKFNLIKINDLKLTPDSIHQMIKILQDDRLKKEWANRNINILKNHFSHKTIAPKLRMALLKRK